MFCVFVLLVLDRRESLVPVAPSGPDVGTPPCLVVLPLGMAISWTRVALDGF